MHLIVPQDEVLESIHVGDVLQLFAVGLDQMLNKNLDILTFDEFEQLQTCRIQKIVPRNVVEKNLQNWLEEFVLDDLSIMRLIMQPNAGTEVFQSSCDGQLESSCCLETHNRRTELQVLLRALH